MVRYSDISKWRKMPGLTLVELLVVIVIMVLLLAVVLPLAQPTPSRRVVREAARQVNSFLANAQSRAVAEGREYGVMFVPTDASNSRCIDLALAKVPPFYAGDDIGAFASYNSATGNYLLHGALRITESYLTEVVGRRFINVGDRLRFNYRAPWYEISMIALNPGSMEPVLTLDSTGKPSPQPGSFQIQRGPRASSAGVMTLPVGAYIDLAVSGIGNSGAILLPANAIMFSKNGRPSTADSIYLLIGSEEQISGAGPVAAWINAVRNLVPEAPSAWLTVSQNTGRIATVENASTIEINGTTASVRDAAGGVIAYDLNDVVQWVEAFNAAVAVSRQSAAHGPVMGGR